MSEQRTARRRFLLSGAAFAGSLAGCGGSRTGSGSNDTEPTGGTDSGGSSPGNEGDQSLDELELRGEPVADGFGNPVGVSVPEPGHLFVVDQPGRIHLVENGTPRESPFLDVSDRMVELSGVTEQGLLGAAFHPGFADNGRFFVRYSAPPRSGTPDDYSHIFVLSEFSVDPGAGTADPDSETPILEFPEPQSNHNAGAVTFGPDGYLYVGVGDGGGGGDQGTGHVEDWYDPVDGGNGQDVTENLLGSILRIDVDGESAETARDGRGETAGGADRPYGIPEDNPLVDEDGLDEHYAWGFRNPWRMSFGPEGRLFVADVGQNDYEEVNVVERGGNYGWNVREGTHCYARETCPDETPGGDPLVAPIIEYPHEGAEVSGISVIGGYRYDGAGIPPLVGTYVFADWRAEGELFVAPERPEGRWPVTAVPVDGIGSYVTSFGRDADGELLVCASDDAGVDGSSGAVYRLRSA